MWCGILFAPYTAIPREYLPQELRFGSGMTCGRKLRDWNDADVWQRLHEVLLGKLRGRLIHVFCACCGCSGSRQVGVVSAVRRLARLSIMARVIMLAELSGRAS